MLLSISYLFEALTLLAPPHIINQMILEQTFCQKSRSTGSHHCGLVDVLNHICALSYKRILILFLKTCVNYMVDEKNWVGEPLLSLKRRHQFKCEHFSSERLIVKTSLEKPFHPTQPLTDSIQLMLYV